MNETERSRMARIIEELVRYANHRYDQPCGQGHLHCTCGLEATVRVAREAAARPLADLEKDARET